MNPPLAEKLSKPKTPRFEFLEKSGNSFYYHRKMANLSTFRAPMPLDESQSIVKLYSSA
jgi:hypothetical protein